MKLINIRSYIVLSLGLLTFSCDSAYDINPDFILTEESTINDVSDLERLLLGTYDSGLGFIPGVLANYYPSDNVVIGQGNNGQGIFGILWQYSSDATSSISDGIWNSAYVNFYAVNRIIDRAETIDLGDANEALRDQITAEALGIRAYELLELLRYYSPAYDANAQSGYIVTEPLPFNSDNIVPFPRNTVGEIASQIRADVSRARQLIGNQDDVYRISDLALQAILVRLDLYINTPESRQEAITLATAILSERPLADEDDYFDMFRNDFESSEVIFKLQRDLNDAAIGSNWRITNGAIYVSMSNGLFNILNPDDIRTDLLLDNETEITEQTVESEDEYVVGKYIGRDVNFPGLQDLIIFRSSEMLLVRAEARARNNNLDQAQDDIELLRSTRGSSEITPDYTSVNIALEDILKERRIELAFEGHRFLDLKRFGLPVSRIPADTQINRGADFLAADDFRFTFPIPQAEIDRNDGIDDSDQNPGYNN